MLTKRAAFYPFAAAVYGDGELRPIAIDEGTETPSPSEMIASLRNLFKNLASQEGIHAAAICYDGRVTIPGKEKQDAITVALEHVNGEAVTIYLPYSKKFLRGYQYGDIIAGSAELTIFG